MSIGSSLHFTSFGIPDSALGILKMLLPLCFPYVLQLTP